ncbi:MULTISPECIES: hypothetical protein [Clostridium]|uniref:hypothetical protein n=1 Tax=Clostridium TaxID=1485 RepID=UPI000585FC90|nr:MULTISPECIES: hypothetical protein [Clostridium]AJE13295.1 hypothetical protein T259_4297 [Clostridium botulinum CDC_1436]KOY66116.1 hypothetical protein AN649_09900 [Clostridium sporogenes]MDS1006459.1 hypothetical protein [Clostridium sporogenes]
MKFSISTLAKNLLQENKGYEYLLTTIIYVPIAKMSLGIIKRKETELQLIEEMILKLININYNTVPDISNILGLDEEIIEFVLGNLHVKELVNILSGSAILSIKGREAINQLKSITNESDVLDDVYLNLLTGHILEDKPDKLTYRYSKLDNLLQHEVSPDIELIKYSISDIKNLFLYKQQTENIYNKGLVNNELISIESINDIFIAYLPIKIHIYKSINGDEIDIIPIKSDKKYYDEISDKMCNQILDKNKLKYIFKNRPKDETILNLNCTELLELNKTKLQDLLCKYVIASTDEKILIENEIESLYYKPRSLLDNEYESIVNILCNSSSRIDLSTTNLNDIIYNDFIIQELSVAAKQNKTVNIYFSPYNNYSNLIKKRSKSIPDLKKINFVKKDDININKIVFNKQNIIYEFTNELLVLGRKYVTKKKYYLNAKYNFNQTLL